LLQTKCPVGRELLVPSHRKLGSGGESVEGGDGFDEAGDGESVADAARLTDKMKGAPNASQRNRNAHERGDAGAVNLRHAVEVNDDFAARLVEDGLQRVGKLVARFADGQAAMQVKNVNAVLLPYVDFDGGKVGHVKIAGQGL